MQRLIDEHLKKQAKEYEDYLKAEASYDTAMVYSQTMSKVEALKKVNPNEITLLQ
jgi:hypothetical protein